MKKYALLFVIFLLAACSGGGTGGAMAQTPSLMSPSDMSNQEAANKNNEGVDHLVQGHYDVSKPLFEQALAAKPDFAEAYFNLGVTLDGMGKHPEATEAFKKALEFGKDNPKISENALLKKHLSM